MKEVTTYRVYSEGYSLYNEHHDIFCGRVAIETLVNDEVIDDDAEYITDKWGGKVITNIDWDDYMAEFANGLIHVYEGKNKLKAEALYKEYLEDEIELDSLIKNQ